MFQLNGKTALITGAGSGIGEATARVFAAAGARVIIADYNADAGQKVAGEIGDNAIFLPLNVADEDACEQLAREVLQKYASLDILANIAGVGHVGTILETPSSDFERMYDVNVRGVFNTSKAFLPSMIEHGSGSIINMASTGGITGLRNRFGYCATKFAVVGMTKAMAIDHAHQGVRINCICPGRTETPFVKARLAEYPDYEAGYREMSATQPIGRMAKPEEIAAAALYLASDEASFITGEALVIDGGFNAGQ